VTNAHWAVRDQVCPPKNGEHVGASASPHLPRAEKDVLPKVKASNGARHHSNVVGKVSQKNNVFKKLFLKTIKNMQVYHLDFVISTHHC
jgi:hypothetical protein